jgi:hypothetical protein
VIGNRTVNTSTAIDVFYWVRAEDLWRPVLKYTKTPIQWVLDALSLSESKQGRKADHHLHLVLRPRMVELYLHSPIRLYSVMLN